jgi:hypothetical protein
MDEERDDPFQKKIAYLVNSSRLATWLAAGLRVGWSLVLFFCIRFPLRMDTHRMDTHRIGAPDGDDDDVLGSDHEKERQISELNYQSVGN